MIAAKMKKMVEGGSAIRAMFEEGLRMAERYGKENVFDFSLGNPNFPAPEKVREAAVSLLENTPPVELHGYMPNAGYPAVRQAVADELDRRFGTAYAAGNIIMTVGAACALNIMLKTLLDPGDEVVVFAPYFLEYGNYVANYDGVLKIVPADPAGGFQLSAEALERAVTERTKAVIINNPNNPTGVIYSETTLRAVAAVLEKKQEAYGRPIYIISDEPYRELAYDGAEVPFIPTLYKNTIVCYSWSKSLSLPGERIGYAAISPEAEDAGLIFDAAVVANRILGFVNAPSLFQRVAAECLQEKADVSGYDGNRRLLYDGLTKCGFTCVYPQGAFYMWVKTPIDEKQFVETAKRFNILLVGGKSFACEGYVRLAYCVSPDMIRRSMPAFEKLAAACGLR